MTELDRVVSAAYASEGKQEDVNKVYLALLRGVLFLPVQKDHVATDEEPFSPLFTRVEKNYFMLTFDTLDRLTNWAGEQFENMNYVELSGKDLVSGLGDNVYLVLNAGTDFHKEFSPDEIKQLKKIVARIEQLKG